MAGGFDLQALLGTGFFETIGQAQWEAVRRELGEAAFDEWVTGLVDLAAAGLGQGSITAFANWTPTLARDLGPEAPMLLAPALLRIVRSAGARPARDLMAVLPSIVTRIGDAEALHAVLDTIGELATRAPESVGLLTGRLGFVMASLNAAGFRRWVVTGLRHGGEDAEARQRYFAMADAESLRVFDQESANVALGDMARRLELLLSSLWRIRPVLKPAVRRAVVKPARRSTFDGAMVRMPETFPGFSGRQAERLFKAASAHIGAHMMFTERFQLRSLKPVQVALISLIEDARVEHLAMREFPGLVHLWRPFHVAEADGGQLALPLMARLSRALIDPAYHDDNPWVGKGREMFFDSRRNWEDQSISRSIGGLLGNDFGQMRVQFNPKTYVVQPAYRDDNLGIWDFGDQQAEASDEAETIHQSARIVEAEKDDRHHHRERMEEDRNRANRARMTAVDEEAGIPVATYPEWDYVLASERRDWTTLVEYQPRRGPVHVIDKVHQDYADVLARIDRLVRQARVSQAVRIRRQAEGDRLDLEAAIRATIDRRARITPDPRVYETSALRGRDLSVLVLLDISESTKDFVPGTSSSVFTLERAATALLAEAMAASGDPFAIHAFCSNGRSDVRYSRIKDFDGAYGQEAKARLSGLRGGFSTRIGAALRHAGTDLRRQRTHRRLLLAVTDGEPSDVDAPDRRYLVEDARRAVQALAHEGIDVFCVGLDGGGESYLGRIFGRRNVVLIDRVSALPEKLPMLYFRLTH